MIWRFGGFELDERSQQLRCGSEVVPIERKPLQLLIELLRAHPRHLSAEALMALLWPDAAVTRSSLHRAVSLARTALGEARGQRAWIGSERGRGYRFLADVEWISHGESPVLVARDEPLRALERALEAAFEGAGGLVLVAGEAGIGKTFLIEHFARTVAGSVQVLESRVPSGEAPVFWLWRKLVRDCALTLPGHVLRRLMRDRESTLLAVAPELGRALGEGAVDVEANRISPTAIQDDVAHFLGEASEITPLVLVLEDLHGAAPESLQLLPHLAAEVLPRRRMLVVGSYRDRGEPPHPALDATIARLVTLPAVRPILTLEAFDREAVALYLEQAARIEDPVRHTQALIAWTGGNPLFLREVTQLIEADPSAIERAIPPSVAAVVRERVRRLGSQARALAEAAAVLAGDGSIRLLAAMAEATEPAVGDRMAELERAGLLRIEAGGRYRFAHELVRAALRDALPPDRVRALHCAAADAIERLHGRWLEPQLPELAYHLFEAGPRVESERLVRHARAAGRAARQRGADSEAVRHFGRALERLVPDSHQESATRCDLLLEFAHAATLSGQGLEATRAIAEATALGRSLCDGARLARAALAHGAWAVPILGDADAIALLEEALEALGPDDASLRLQTTAQLAIQRHYAGRYAEGNRLLAQVLGESERFESPGIRAEARTAHLAAIQQGRCHEPADERLRLAGLAIEEAQKAGRSDLLFQLRRLRVSILNEQGNRGELDAEIARFDDLVGRTRTASQRHYVAAFRAGQLLARGEFEGARRKIADARRTADARDPSQYLFTPTTLRMLLPLEPDEARELLGLVDQILESFPDARGWRTAIGLLQQHVGDRKAIQRSLDETLRDGVASFLIGNMTDATVLAALAEASHAVGDTRHADELLAQLAPYAGRNVDVGWGAANYGPVDYYRGLCASLLGRHEDAEACFASASDMNAAMGQHLFEVRTQLARAHLASRRDAERARSIARSALPEAERMGVRREAMELRAIAGG